MNLSTQYLGWFPKNYAQITQQTHKLPPVPSSTAFNADEANLIEEEEEGEEEESSLEEKRKMKLNTRNVSSSIAHIQRQLRSQPTQNVIFTESEEQPSE